MMTPDKIVLDLETQKAFDEVGGRADPGLLKISVVGIYRYATDEYRIFEESELKELEELLNQAQLVIGFNIKKFDFPVLQPYAQTKLDQLPVLDIMEEVAKVLGHRVSLDSLASATLGSQKTGTGLDALRYFKEGRMQELKDYCLHDVKLTKELYDYARAHGQLKCSAKFGDRVLTIPVCWPDRRQDVKTIANIIQEGYNRKLSVEIEYLSTHPTPGESSQVRRQVDIYHYDGTVFEAHCRLRQQLRTFRLDRVIEAKITWNRYSIPHDYQAVAVEE